MPLRKPSGKRMASGTGTNGSGTITVTFANGTTSTGYNFVQVTGLGFLPSRVIIRSSVPGQSYIQQSTIDTEPVGSVYIRTGRVTNVSFYDYQNSVFTRFYRLDGTHVYMNETGFRVPWQTTNAPFEWVAYE